MFCEPEDDSALWLAGRLSDLGADLSVSLPEELVVGSRFSLEIDDNSARPFAELASGTIIDHETTDLIIARMKEFPLPPLMDAADSDLVYGAEEVRAALVGWFNAWNCPVLGCPAPYSAYGDSGSDAEWRAMASYLSIDVVADGKDAQAVGSEAMNDVEVLVVAGQVFPHEGLQIDQGCARDARALHSLQNDDVAVFRFQRDADGLRFERKNHFPDFRSFGVDPWQALLAGIWA